VYEIVLIKLKPD